MKPSHLLALLVALALVLVGAGWWFSRDALSTPEAAAEAPQEPAPGGEPEEAAGAGPASDLAAPEVGPTARAERSADDLLEGVVWVEGRVAFPGGCAADAGLEVFALTEARQYRGFVRRMEQDEEPALAFRRPVAEDGSFRLPFPEDRAQGWVMLRGRHLYLPRAVPVELAREPGETPRPLVLAPDAGAHLTGRVLLPEGVDATELADVGLSLEAELANLNTANRGAFERTAVRAELAVDAEGRFAFAALPVVSDYALALEHPRLAPSRSVVAGLVACGERSVEVALAHGGSLSGRVVDATGQRLAGVTVVASLPGQFFGIDDRGVREGETAADGTFRLEGVPAGRVSLRARGSGWLEGDKVTATVTEGEEVAGLELVLTRGASIAGSVSWEDGRPAAGARVSVAFDMASIGGMDFFNALRGAEGSAEAGEDGRFVVTGLGKGPFVVRARAEAPLEPGAAGQGQGDTVRWRARVDAVQPDTEGLALVLSPPLGLAGRVVDDLGEPVTAFRLHLRRKSTGPMAGIAQEESERSQEFESGSGAFLVEDLEAGTVEVWVQDDEHLSLALTPVAVPSTEPVELVAVRAARVTGRVVDPGGAPVAGARVSSGTGGGDLAALLAGGLEPAGTESDGDGRFDLRGVLPQAGVVSAQHEDWARSAAVDIAPAPGERLDGLVLALTEGGTLTGEIYADDGSPAPGRLITVMGMDTMLAQGGLSQRLTRSDADGLFRIERLEPGPWQVTAMDLGRQWTGDDGEMDMGALMSSLTMAQADIVEGEVTHVVLGAPPEDPVRVSGRVTLDGVAFTPATVSFVPEGQGIFEGLAFTAVDDDGHYELVLDGPGQYAINVQVLGGGPGQQSTIEYREEVPEVEQYVLDFALPLGRLSGRVVDSDGEVVGGARVTVTLDSEARSDRLWGGQYSERVADERGRFDVVGLRPGTYRVSAGGAGFLGMGGGEHGRVTKGGVKLAEDQWIDDLVLEVPEAGVLELLVRGVDGRPAAGATVFVRDAEGRPLEPFSMASTDGGGRCHYAGLAPGEYTVLARNATHTTEEVGPVTVGAEGTQSLELQLGEGTIVRVVLQEREGGEPVVGSVRVIDEHGRDMASLFGLQDIQYLYGQGGFSPTEHRLGPLPPGRYEVYARNPDGEEARKPVVLRGGEERKVVLRLR